jgi:cell division protein FtsL
MLEIFVTVGLSFLAFALIVWAFMHLRTPQFRMTRKLFVQLLEKVIEGQADDSDWRVLTAHPMRHDAQLEKIRRECLQIERDEYTGKPPYLFSEAGQARLRALHRQLMPEKTDV